MTSRSLFRFSLRSLLVVISVAAVWCAFHANRGRYERSVERELIAAGAKVDSGLDRVTGKPRDPSTSERFLRSVFAQRFIRRVQSQHKPLVPELLDRVWHLPHLESVSFIDCQLSDHHFQSLGYATGLEMLQLLGPGPTDEGLKGLESLKQMRYVHISQADVGDATLRRLAGLQWLETIELHGTSITGQNVPSLACRRTLIRFAANDSPFHNDFLATLAACRNLQYLELVRTEISDDGVAHLRGHPSLQIVELGAENLTDVSLEIAATIPQLKQLSVPGKRMSKKAFQEFQIKRPKVRL